MHDFGKIPPQAVELEEAILGALMVDSNISYLIDEIKPEIFYQETHKQIFDAIKRLYKQTRPIDILTVTQALKVSGELEAVGGAYKIDQLTDNVYSGAHTDYHIKIVWQKWVQRELIVFCETLRNRCFDDIDDVFDLVEEAQNKLISVSNQTADNLKHIQDCITDVFKIIDHNYKNENQLTGVPTGFTKIDRFTSGLQKSDLIIIAGETSQGKTSVALNIAGNAATIFNKTIGIWSYEMSTSQLTARLMAQASGISSKVLLTNKLETHQFETLNTKIKKLIEANIYIDDVSDSSIEYLERQVRAAVIKKGIDLAIIDYIQLIKNGNSTNKSQQVGDIANRVKSLAKTMNIPVILISQLARSDRHFPTLSRLKESGDIENAADIVWLLWRPDMFGEDEIDLNGESVSSAGMSHHIFAKGRNIGLADFVLKYNPALTLFEDIDKVIDVPF